MDPVLALAPSKFSQTPKTQKFSRSDRKEFNKFFVVLFIDFCGPNSPGVIESPFFIVFFL